MPTHAEVIERLIAERDEARREARDLAVEAYGENWALWETAARVTPWLITPELVQVYPFLAEWLEGEREGAGEKAGSSNERG